MVSRNKVSDQICILKRSPDCDVGRMDRTRARLDIERPYRMLF